MLNPNMVREREVYSTIIEEIIANQLKIMGEKRVKQALSALPALVLTKENKILVMTDAPLSILSKLIEAFAVLNPLAKTTIAIQLLNYYMKTEIPEFQAMARMML